MIIFSSQNYESQQETLLFGMGFLLGMHGLFAGNGIWQQIISLIFGKTLAMWLAA